MIGAGAGQPVGDDDALDHVGLHRVERTLAEPNRDRRAPPGPPPDRSMDVEARRAPERRHGQLAQPRRLAELTGSFCESNGRCFHRHQYPHPQ